MPALGSRTQCERLSSASWTRSASGGPLGPRTKHCKRFAATTMQGKPPRAYLLARAPVVGELTPLLTADGPSAVTGSRPASATWRAIFPAVSAMVRAMPAACRRPIRRACTSGFLDGVGGDQFALRYPIGNGAVTLRRRAPQDGNSAPYWCQQWTRARLASPQ